jgi:hypothetical protein
MAPARSLRQGAWPGDDLPVRNPNVRTTCTIQTLLRAYPSRSASRIVELLVAPMRGATGEEPMATQKVRQNVISSIKVVARLFKHRCAAHSGRLL